MPEGPENHCEYIHSPSIVQILHVSNALGLIGMKQVLCQYWQILEIALKGLERSVT